MFQLIEPTSARRSPRTTGETIIDVSHAQQAKHGQLIAGDVLLSRRLKEEGRVLLALSDGLGSGVKASVLANLTATMALQYAAGLGDVREGAKTIMDTLPVCEVRKISYSTFTILDIEDDGAVNLIQHGDPDAVVLRGPREVAVGRRTWTLEGWKDRLISESTFGLELGDRVICCSDGVTQSGMGQAGLPLGWERERMVRFAAGVIEREPDVPAARLARLLVDEALANDEGRAKDDITAAVVHLRTPRRLLVLTGPPFDRERDRELAEAVKGYRGRTAICGGTTATIVSRQLGREVVMDLSHLDPEIPPASTMEGVDLVTEGTLTLARTVELLGRDNANGHRPGAATNAAQRLAALMLDSDVVDFIVGTRINEAHQDPNVPVELDLRRNLIRRLGETLEGKHLKQVSVRFV